MNSGGRFRYNQGLPLDDAALSTAPSYSKQEFDLVTRVMDTVDDLRQNATTPLDAHRVKALVIRTYADQGIDVPDGLVDQALATALDAFPAVKVEPKESLLSVLDAGRWWENKPTTSPTDTPVEVAKRHIEQLLSHPLLTQQELNALVHQARASVNAERVAFRRKQRNRSIQAVMVGAACWGVPLVLMHLNLSLGLNLSLALPLIWVGTMLMARPLFGNLEVKHFLSSELRQVDDALKAYQSMEWQNYHLGRIIALSLHSMETTYRPEILGEEGDYLWGQAHRAARQDPVLARTWRAWLSSDKPIRKGDAQLLVNTAEKIREAKTWMALHERNPAIQRAMRQSLLQDMGPMEHKGWGA